MVENGVKYREVLDFLPEMYYNIEVLIAPWSAFLFALSKV